MSYPKFSILITVANDGTTVVTQYSGFEAKQTAEAALATALGLGLDAYLYLEPQPTRSIVAPKWSGTYTDAYGAVRVVGTNVLD